MDQKKILYALEFSAQAHQNQLRKNVDRDVPYISHPAAVGYLLLQFGFSDEVVMAGILHDTIEDTTVSLEGVKKDFGDEVAELVAGVTEDKSLDFVPRKQQYFEHIKTASPEVKAICAADQIANITSTLVMHERGENLKDSLFKSGVEAARWVAENRLATVSQDFRGPIVDKLKEVTAEYLEILKLYT